MTENTIRNHLYEIQKAGERLGNSYDQVMDWMLYFAQLSIADLGKMEWEDLVFEVECFTEYGGNHGFTERENEAYPMKNWEGKLLTKKNPLKKKVSPQFLIRAPNIFKDSFHALQCSLPSKKQIESLQNRVREIVGDLVDLRMIFFEMPHTKELIIPLSPSSRKHPSHLKSIFVDTPENLFFHHFIVLLNIFSHQLRRCPECGKVFLAERRHKRFCSSTCQTRVATRRLRNTPLERIGKRGRPRKQNSKEN